MFYSLAKFNLNTIRKTSVLALRIFFLVVFLVWNSKIRSTYTTYVANETTQSPFSENFWSMTWPSDQPTGGCTVPMHPGKTLSSLHSVLLHTSPVKTVTCIGPNPVVSSRSGSWWDFFFRYDSTERRRKFVLSWKWKGWTRKKASAVLAPKVGARHLRSYGIWGMFGCGKKSFKVPFPSDVVWWKWNLLCYYLIGVNG